MVSWYTQLVRHSSRWLANGQRLVALSVITVIIALPLACVLHCHLERALPQPLIVTQTIAGVTLFICHQPDGNRAPPPLDPVLLQRLSEWATRPSFTPAHLLLLMFCLPTPRRQWHSQICLAPPTPPPRCASIYVSCADTV